MTRIVLILIRILKKYFQMKKIIFLAAAISANFILNAQNYCFSDPLIQFGFGNTTRSVTSYGDFDHNGAKDLVFIMPGSTNCGITVGMLDGNVSSTVNLTYSGSANTPRSATVADFNGDGNDDIAVVCSGSNNVHIFLGNGTFGFSPSTFFNIGTAPFDIASGDFNSDGKIDLAVVNNSSSNISVTYGVGNGTFSGTLTFGTPATGHSIQKGDFNNDNKIDFVIASQANFVFMLTGNGLGSFAMAANISVSGSPFWAEPVDVNNDGNLEGVSRPPLTEFPLSNKSQYRLLVYET